MVDDDSDEQYNAVHHAVDLGVTFFDTAAGYGQGKSEANLGAALQDVNSEIILATKVRLEPSELDNPKAATIASFMRSLERLGRESVDLIQIHNLIAPNRDWPIGLVLSPEDVLAPEGVLDGFKELRDRGVVRFFGFTGMGDPQSLLQLVNSGEFDTVQAYFNMLNPSAGHPVPNIFSALNYQCLIDRAAEQGMGVLGVRSLALGALTEEPGLLGFLKNPPPLLSPGSEFEEDVRRAEKLGWLVEGETRSITQAAIRFALMKSAVSTVVVGFSTTEQLGQIVACSGAPGLSEEAMDRLRAIWSSNFS
jgi:aryl-alcohol dehydrogenase-like predicted oxidoreductase